MRVSTVKIDGNVYIKATDLASALLEAEGQVDPKLLAKRLLEIERSWEKEEK